MFRNFENLFYQIKMTLLNSEDVRKLVVYNTSDALTIGAVPTVEKASPAIYIKPIIYVYDDSPEIGISSFISIGLVESIISDGSIEASIKISVACRRDVWMLDNNRVRPLAILNEIAKLDNVKFENVAGKLSLAVIKEVYFNTDLVGYTALFDIYEEKGDVVNEF